MSATRKCDCGGRKDAVQVACADCWNKVPQEIRDSFLSARRKGMRRQHYIHCLMMVKRWLRENVAGWQKLEQQPPEP